MGKTAILLTVAMLLGTAAMADCGPQTKYRKARRGTWGFVHPSYSTYGTTYDFATTSSTSGCSPNDWFSIGARRAEQLEFIVHSQEQLETDISRGSGPYLSSLLTLFGCDSGAETRARLSLQLQASRLLPPEVLLPHRFREVVSEIVHADPIRSGSCGWG